MSDFTSDREYPYEGNLACNNFIRHKAHMFAIMRPFRTSGTERSLTLAWKRESRLDLKSRFQATGPKSRQGHASSVTVLAATGKRNSVLKLPRKTLLSRMRQGCGVVSRGEPTRRNLFLLLHPSHDKILHLIVFHLDKGQLK